MNREPAPIEDVMDLSIQLEKVLELFSSFILFSRLRIEAGLVTIKCDFELALRLRKKKIDGESKVKGCCVENEICIFNMQSGKRIMRNIREQEMVKDGKINTNVK